MIIVRSPLRISLAGGGTDLQKYYQTGLGAVCSFAINKYVYVTVNNLSSYFPHRLRVAYSQTELVQEVSNIKHPIVKAALEEMKITGGIDVNVMADIPAGTGMGSSSAFTVGLLQALYAFKQKLVDKERLASEACRLEIELLKEPIGKQDQYAAAFGGINLIRFHANERVEVEPLPLNAAFERFFLNHMMLFYLGGSRSAGDILKVQSANIANHLAQLDEMKTQAITTAEILLKSARALNQGGESAAFLELHELGPVLQRGWALKRSLASDISNQKIDEVMQKAYSAGAFGGKLLGAGGQGFVLLFVPPEKRTSVGSALTEYREVEIGMDHMGSTLLYYGG